jgi:hypothetical protein
VFVGRGFSLPAEAGRDIEQKISSRKKLSK